MDWLFYAFVGWILGGVINVVADSLPTTGALAVPHCHACGAPRPKRAWLALSALLTGRFRCAYCRVGIRYRAVLVEVISAAGAVWLYDTGLGPSGYLPALLITELFLLIAVIDIEQRLILHAVSLPSIVILALYGALAPSRGLGKTLLGGAAGFGIVLILFLFGALFARWVARRRGKPLDEVAFGFGDVTLATLIGVVVGWPGIVLALMVGVLSAGAFGLLVVLVSLARGRYQPYMPIPYGPFLILGGLLVYLGGRGLFTALLSV